MRRAAFFFLLAVSGLACTHDFAVFEGAADGAVGEAGTREGGAADGASSDATVIMDASVDTTPCTPLMSCLTTATSCATMCTQAEVACENAGGCNPGCRNMCKSALTTCKAGCATSCESCTNAAGCSAVQSCSQAAN